MNEHNQTPEDGPKPTPKSGDTPEESNNGNPIPQKPPTDEGIIPVSTWEEIMRSRMSEEDRSELDILKKVGAVYVETARDDLFKDLFMRYFKLMMAANKGQVIFVTGESGSGKSKIVEHLLKTHPLAQHVPHPTGPLRPAISITLQGPATPRAVGAKILHELTGNRPRDSVKENVIWENLPAIITKKLCKIIHIDELQHALRNEYDIGRLADCLKGLMNNADWPIGLIVSGMPGLNTMINLDEQNERRHFSFPLPSVSMPENSALVKKIIRSLCEAAKLDCEQMLTEDLPDRIAHAARYQFGRIAEVTFAAIQIALQDGVNSLGREHFADAYVDHSHTRDHDELNPFKIKDWKHLQPGYFVTKKFGERED